MRYFDIDELSFSLKAQELGIENRPNAEEIEHLTEVVDNILDPFREHLGHPINVSSGFRNEQVNKAVGGSKTSAHRIGYAVDIYCRFVSTRSLWVILLTFCRDRGIKYDQIFIERDSKGNVWVHVGYKNCAREQRMQSGEWYKG